MNTYLVIRQSDGLVTNAIRWDAVTPWQPPDGHIVVQAPADPTAGIGWTLRPDGGWQPPAEPAPEPT